MAAVKVTEKGVAEMTQLEADGLARAQRGLGGYVDLIGYGGGAHSGAHGGGTGVFEAIAAAVALRPPQIVLPCADLDTGASFMASERGLAASPLHDLVLVRPGSTVEDVYGVLKHHPYHLVKGDFVRAEGMGMPQQQQQHPHQQQQQQQQQASGFGKRRLLKKDEVVTDANNVLRVWTNQKSQWQNKSIAALNDQQVEINKQTHASKSSGGRAPPKEAKPLPPDPNAPSDKKARDLEKLLKRLHKSSDRQGKSKGGKGTGQHQEKALPKAKNLIEKALRKA